MTSSKNGRPLTRQLVEDSATTRGRLGHWLDEVIKEAEQQGDFEYLPGKGKPTNLGDSDPYAGPEADVYKVLKNAGFAPEWIELRSKIVADMNWMRANPGHPERVSRIVETNLLIDKHNGAVPSGSLALPKLPRNFPDK